MLNVQFNAGRSRQAIREALGVLEDMTPVYTDIGEYLLQAHRKRFARGVGPDGKAWAPKRAATLERYKRLGYASLGRPLIGPGKALSRQIQRLVSRDGVVIGSSLIYSRVMQEGAAKGEFGRDGRGRPVPWGRIPADDDARIVGFVDEHLEGKLEKPA
jgi:phage gpG-like protein